MRFYGPAMDFKTQLKREFVERKRRNAAYSLRAFAKSLAIDQSLLSKILQGQREPSPQTIQKVSERLGIDPHTLGVAPDTPRNTAAKYDPLQGEASVLLTHWEHFAILELFKTKSFRSDHEWIAKRLGLSIIEIEIALQRLAYFGFIDTRKKKWQTTKPNITWTDLTQTSVNKVFLQRRLLEKATEAVEQVPFSRRENASLTIQCSPKMIPKIKRRIDAFLDELDKFIESEGPHDDVYQTVVSFYPLTQGENR